MLALMLGVSVIVRNPSLWAAIWRPLLLACALYAAIFIAGMSFLLPVLHNATALPDWLRLSITAAGGLVFAFVWMYFSGVIYLGIVAVCSAFWWDGVSLAVEMLRYGNAPRHSIGCIAIMIDGIARAIMATLAVVAIVVFGWFGLPLVLVFAGVLSLLDFTAPLYLRRGILVFAQMKSVISLPGAMGFAIACAAMSLIPPLFIVAMPAMVAGGTILVRESNQAFTSR